MVMPAGFGIPTRREFMGTGVRLAAGACFGCSLWPGRCAFAGTPPLPKFEREVDFYERLPGRRIQCFVCPLLCKLEDGQTCFCRTRTNHGGRLLTHAYNNPCILRLDPIEKLPLNHFRPGTRTLSIGFGGCNLRCLYCQNWEHSQSKPDEVKTIELTPKQAVEAARNKGVDTIAFTYTEPVVFMEYAKDLAQLAREEGLRVVVATAAFAEPEPLLDFAQYVDAFVVALKGFTEDFYKVVCGSRLAPVLTAIEALHKRSKSWLELITLIVPTYNDHLPTLEQMFGWIRSHLGCDVPLHLARFVPQYRLTNLPQTPVQILDAAREAAMDRGLRYVYTSNIAPHEGNHTYCPKCGALLIERLGLKLIGNKLHGDRCPACRRQVPGVWS
jgi:pyruvate formate lyase activating enzyme